MQLGKVKPTATIVAQFAAGVEVDAIQHEGKIFLPAIALGEFATSESTPERKKEPTPEPAPSKPSKESKPAPKETKDEDATASAKTYTKDEMMEMSSKDLEKILKKEYGIDPDDYDGKNTNKKLRDLILEAQKKAAKSAPAKEEPKKESKEDEDDEADNDELVTKVASILTDFDGGKLSRKKAVAAIADACDAETDDVNELLDKFEDDSDTTPEDFAQTIVDELTGDAGSTEEPEGEEVDASDLEKGDKVSVWWNDENQAWYTGVVDSVKRGKVHIKYDDGTDDDIDPEIHTRIVKLD